MTSSDSAAVENAGEEFVFTRIINASRDVVWKSWTEPARLMHWWGPQGFTMREAKTDLRPGGMFHYGMRSPDGNDMWGKFVFREVAYPERLTFIVSFSDENGGVTRHPLSDNWPLEVLNSLEFIETEGKTAIILRGSPVNATEEEGRTFTAGHQSMQQGFKGTMDRLSAYLASEVKGENA